MRAFIGSVLLAVAAHTSTAVAQTWTQEQQELWRLEEQQWKMAAAKDPSWMESMVHPNISYWDTDQPGPQNKASLTRWVKYNYANSTVLEQELFPIAMTITGNVAVVHYHYRIASENTKGERAIVTGRYTDVLVKEGNRWLFIAWAGGDDPKK